MAILKFPIGTHMGELIWEKNDAKFSAEEIENAIIILRYMGYDASINFEDKGLIFSQANRNFDVDRSVYRNIVFDFILLFQNININLPNLEYAKIFLRDLYIPLGENNVIFEQKIIVYNEIFYLVLTDNYMLKGDTYFVENPFWIIDDYNQGKSILPIIARNKINDLIFKIKLDIAEGIPLNDPFYNNELLIIEEALTKNILIDDHPENDLPF